MHKIICFLAAFVCAVCLAGCQGQESKPAASAAKSVAAVDEIQGKTALSAYLKALQNRDKKAAYAAANFSEELLEKSRKELVNQPVKKLTAEQVKAAENILRVSGSIDLYLKRLPQILLKSAAIEVVKTAKWSPKSPNVLLHEVKVTYPNKKEAISDKTGGRVKEFVLRFLQIQYESDGRLVQEFLIEDKDFENMVARKLDVKAYF
jgi:hypothetical protein